MECFGPICQGMQCAWPTLACRIGYVRYLPKNFKKLTNAIEDLCSRKDDLNAKINRNKPFKKPSNECRAWIEKMEKIESQVMLIENEIGSTRRCFNIGCCFPDIYSRMSLGKRIMTLLEDVNGLKEASSFTEDEVVDSPLTVVQNLSMPPITENQASIDIIVQKLLKCIREEKNQRVGLWGMGGVGKTTVMKKLNNQPEIEQEFEIVIWVTVSKDWTVRKLQIDVANRLQIDINDKDSDESVAGRLNLKLQTMKYLLLLDDLWRQVDLIAVGIPNPSKEIGSKIVLTSRSVNVCNEMETDENVKVNPLYKEEAWRLFCEKVGEAVNSSKIEPIAREIVEECGGLPLAILVIGGSLRRVVDIHVWKNFLDELKSASFGIGHMEELVFEQLKISYERLSNDHVKDCFLYCALYPEDWVISVDELIEHWRVEGFIVGMKTMEKAYNKAHTILNSLISDSLLERCENGVKMHDMVRDLALRLTSLNESGPRFLVRAGREIKECPNVEEWEKAERISLMDTNICYLPEIPRCNSLSTLLLRIPLGVKLKITSTFFQHMHNLRVLRLHQQEDGVGALPSFVSSLVNLRGLYIISDHHHVSLPSVIGELKRLEVMYVIVQSLPPEVRLLTRLRSLRIGFLSVDGMRTMCSEGVISSFYLLEDLRISFGNLGLVGQWHEMVDLAVAEELGNLKHLTNLQFGFSTAECLEHFLIQRQRNNFPQLRDFLISVAVSNYIDEGGLYGSPDYKYEIGKKLWWCAGEKTSDGEIIQLLSQTYKLGLRDHKTATNLLDFGIKNIKRLEVCRVEKCMVMETILDGNGSSRNAILPNLQELSLTYLPKLRSIFNPPQVFSKLTILNVTSCRKLRYIFSWVMIQQMSNLEKLYTGDCGEIEEIVAREEQVENDDYDVEVFFPKLKILRLEYNRKLVRIWKGVSQPWPSLEELTIWSCPILKTVNLKVGDNASALKIIRGKRERWEALEWEDDHDKHLLQPLFHELS